MLGPPPTEWTRTTWFFVLLGLWFVVGFVVSWIRFQRAERAVKGGDPAAAARFNRMLRGFPNAIYAKMLGKRPYEVARNPD